MDWEEDVISCMERQLEINNNPDARLEKTARLLDPKCVESFMEHFTEILSYGVKQGPDTPKRKSSSLPHGDRKRTKLR